MKKYLIIEADYNDGDYVISRNKISDENLELIKPVIKAIKENNGDYRTGEQGSGAKEAYGHIEGFKVFNQYVPNAEFGVHTIESINLLEVVNEQRLL